MSTALRGMRVVELSETAAGAYCGKLLADFGADVVRVELRHPGESLMVDDLAAAYLYLNTNKRSVALELPGGWGEGALRRLVAKADVVLDDLRERWKQAEASACADYVGDDSTAVWVSTRAFGHGGPYEQFQSTHLVDCALSGWLYECGDLDRPPLMPAQPLSEYVTGMYAAIGALTAWLDVERSGHRREVSVATQEALNIIGIFPASKYGWSGTVPRRGSLLSTLILECADGYVGWGTLTDDQWTSLAMFVGDERLQSEEFATSVGRNTHAHRVAEILADFFRTHDGQALFEEGQAWRIPVNLVPTVAELLEFPQHAERNYFVKPEHPNALGVRYPGAPFKLTKSPADRWRPAPRAGEHNIEVLESELGLPPLNEI